MPTIAEVRKKYPQYNDLPDQALADSLHAKFYSDLPKEDFYSKIGFSTGGITTNNTPSLNQAISSLTPTNQTMTTPTTGFVAEVDADLQKRAQEYKDILARPQSATSRGLQVMGLGPKYVADMLGNEANAITPDFIKDPLMMAAQGASRLGQNIAETGTGAFLGNLMGQGVDYANELARNHPVTAADADALFSLGSVIPAVKGARGTVEKGAGLASDVGKTIAINTPRGVKDALASEAGRGIAFPVKAPVYSSEELSGMANKAYKTATSKGGVLSESFTNKFIDDIQKVTPQTEAGRLLGGDDPVTKVVQKFDNLRDRKLSLDEAQEVDEFLGGEVDRLADKTTGRLTKEAKKILDIQTSFRNMIDKVTPGELTGGREGFNALKEGRARWSQAARMRDIEKIITRAELSDNPATAIKSGFRTLATNPNRLKGYTAQERILIKKAADSGIISDTLRKVVSSRLLPIISAGSGGGLGQTAAMAGANLAAKNVATKIQVGKANRVAEAIAGRKVK